MCTILRDVHGADVAHGDIHEGNIMVSGWQKGKVPEVYYIDFGFSRKATPKNRLEDIQCLGFVMGTVEETACLLGSWSSDLVKLCEQMMEGKFTDM